MLAKVKKTTRSTVVHIASLLADRCGYVVLDKTDTIDLVIHEYDSYEEYKSTQIRYNKKKIQNVWADEITLGRVSNILSDRFGSTKITGICHGSRNGFEQKFLNSAGIGVHAIGTDISDTATEFEDTVQWDFHDVNEEWVSAFDFVYTNSLDQSWKPKEALTVWLNQLNENGVLLIEHTEAHGPSGASHMDPFGVRPKVLPYVLTMWFGDQISISHTVAKKANWDMDAWLFVISKNVETVIPL